jgi:quinol monooxygenase YgiN
VNVSVIVTVRLTAADRNANAVLGELAGALPVTRTREGCQSVTTVVSQDSPKIVTLIQRWDRREQFEAYIAWRESTGDLARLLALTENGNGVVTEFWNPRPE